jgi:hypothetical protein
VRYVLVLAFAALGAGVGVWLIAGGENGEEDAASRPVGAGGQPAEFSGPPPGMTADEADEADEEDSVGEEAASREAQRAVRRYIEAISDHDGVLLCGTVDGIAALDLPVRRPGCSESVSESIGYRDPRGFPVFESAVVSGAPLVEASPRDARATVTVITEFADRDEPSVEDDVIYLVRRAGEWRIAKPSSTLYRAIGVSDVPPDVLEPPRTG